MESSSLSFVLVNDNEDRVLDGTFSGDATAKLAVADAASDAGESFVFSNSTPLVEVTGDVGTATVTGAGGGGGGGGGGGWGAGSLLVTPRCFLK